MEDTRPGLICGGVGTITEEPEIAEVSYNIPHSIMIATLETFESAKENAVDLLADLDTRLGRTTRGNKALGELYETDVHDCQKLISHYRKAMGLDDE